MEEVISDTQIIEQVHTNLIIVNDDAPSYTTIICKVKLSDSFVPLVAKLVWKHLGNSSYVSKWRYLRLQKTHYDKAEHPFDRIEEKDGRSETALYRYINASSLVGHLLNKNMMHAFLRRDRGWRT
ncbi:hypothetical protein PoB_004186200 [Plakobranchus ocellatus]|uniref:Uncharacterized protein n=1 Tax=Plakobranchus ocellatus TaxID=259542 RepID=A0AAV4B875_9GAST|nr:hypothetical protein PoB_004186200 [Plakobranchus ocellatus]